MKYIVITIIMSVLFLVGCQTTQNQILDFKKIGPSPYYNEPSSFGTKTQLQINNATIYDPNTNLEWTKEAFQETYQTTFMVDEDGVRTSTEYYSGDPSEICANLTLNGQTDWRLPSIYEMLTVVRIQYPLVPAEEWIPQTTHNIAYITSTHSIILDDNPQIWSIRLANHEYSNAELYLTSSPRSFTELFVCVRSESFINLPNNESSQHRYKYISANTVLDLQTGLIWQQKPKDKTTNWNDAKNYCQNLQLDGYDDWRMPTMFEMMTSTDQQCKNSEQRECSYENLNEQLYSNIESSHFYWTSTTTNEHTVGWFNPTNLKFSWISKNNDFLRVRCVRDGIFKIQ